MVLDELFDIMDLGPRAFRSAADLRAFYNASATLSLLFLTGLGLLKVGTGDFLCILLLLECAFKSETLPVLLPLLFYIWELMSLLVCTAVSCLDFWLILLLATDLRVVAGLTVSDLLLP